MAQCHCAQLARRRQTPLIWGERGAWKDSPVRIRPGSPLALHMARPRAHLLCVWLLGAATTALSAPQQQHTPITLRAGEEGPQQLACGLAGERRWAFPTSGDVDSSPTLGPDGTVYVGSSDHNLYAVMSDGGTLKWSYPTDLYVTSSPTVGPDGTIYVGSSDGKLYAVTPEGKLRWEYETQGPVISSPALGPGGDTVYVGSQDTHLYAVNTADGTLKWSFPTDNFVWGSPVLAPDGATVYVGSYGKTFYAVGAADGEQKWTFTTEGTSTSPAVGPDGTVFVGSGASHKGVVSAMTADGELKWSYKFESNKDVRALTVGPDGTIYASIDDGKLHAISAAGAQMWTFSAGEGDGTFIANPPTVGPDGTIYVGGWYTLYALTVEKLQNGDTKAALKWSYKTGSCGGSPHTCGMLSSPAVGPDNTVYVGARDHKLHAVCGGCQRQNYFPGDAATKTCTRYCKAEETCHGHGSCSVAGKCECEADYYPNATCKTYCNRNLTCHGHGSCNPDGHLCDCDGEWGANPQAATSRCDANPCQTSNNCGPHGNCRVVGDVHTCTCLGEWEHAGPNPNDPCTVDPCEQHNEDCGVHGTCVVVGEVHACRCTENYAGEKCDEAPCFDATGVDDGNCTRPLRSGQHCIPKCDQKHLPLGGQSPGQYFISGGPIGAAGKALRSCSNGQLTANAKCELCSEDKCQHRGVCKATDPDDPDNAGHGYKCLCLPGRSGIKCELVDQCAVAKPCEYGGICTRCENDGTVCTPEDVKQGYHCTCKPGFSALNCSTVDTVWSHQWQLMDAVAVMASSAAGVGYAYLFTFAPHNAESLYVRVHEFAAVRTSPSIATWIFRLTSVISGAAVWTIGGSHWLLLLLSTLLSTTAQLGFATLWASQMNRFRPSGNDIATRLWSGVAVPILAMTAVATTAAHVYWVQQKSERLDVEHGGVFQEQVWSVVSFGVVMSALPMAIVLRQTYTFTQAEAAVFTQILAKHDVHRGELFISAQKAFAAASGLMPFCVWLPYMATEMHTFLRSLPTDEMQRSDRKINDAKASVDGVRALAVVVAVLNLASVAAIVVAVVNLPAPQVWAPYMFFGVIWSLLSAAALLYASAALVWSLSEPRDEAVSRDSDARRSARDAAAHVAVGAGDSGCPRCTRSSAKQAFDYILSWQGQTLLSTINHVFSIVVFVSLLCMPDRLTAEITVGLIIGVVLSLAGMLVSGVSLGMRRWPRLKMMPTDDSFRVVSTLKIALVMTKATIVFLARRSNSFGKMVMLSRFACCPSR